jgi:hypothetical protein
MPCYTPDPGPSPEEILESKMPAVLCGVLSKHGASILDGLDWKEIGVTKDEAFRWWDQHKRKDASRKKREAEYEAARTKRNAALAKLTPEERAIIGVAESDGGEAD